MDDVATYSCVGPIGAAEASGLRAGRLAAERECPYVNRSDERCAEHKTLGGISYAYDHCFDAYRACPVYRYLATGGDVVIGSGIDQWRAGRPKHVEITVRRKIA